MIFQTMIVLAAASAFDDDSGVISHAAMPTPQYEVAAQPWFVNSETVEFAGDAYVKFGLPLQLSPLEIEAVEPLNSVPVFIEAGNFDADVIYFMVSSAECAFQPYARP